MPAALMAARRAEFSGNRVVPLPRRCPSVVGNCCGEGQFRLQVGREETGKLNAGSVEHVGEEYAEFDFTVGNRLSSETLLAVTIAALNQRR